MSYKYEADTHTHTIASGHAYNTIREMAEYAARLGLKVLAVTDHSRGIPREPSEKTRQVMDKLGWSYGIEGAPLPLYFSNFKVIERDIYGIHLLMGVETNVLNDGTVDLPLKTLKRVDLVIASIHSQCFLNEGIEENTRAVMGVMNNPWVDILGHPDDSNMPLDYEQIVNHAAETGTILEVNENSYRSNLRSNCEENTLTYLQLCKEKHVYAVIGSDAHFIDRVGVHDRAEAVMHKVDFPEELVLNSNAEKLREYLAFRKFRAAHN